MNQTLLRNDFEKVSYLAQMLEDRATGGTGDNSEFMALRVELLQNPEISEYLPSWLRIHRSLDSFWGFIKSKFDTYADRRSFLSAEFTVVLNYLELDIKPEKAFPATKPKNTQGTAPRKIKNQKHTQKKKIFIVHGRDNEAKQEVARYVEKIGLEAIVLHEMASSGMTIIEKIERYSSEVDFAITLYTPCDLGRGIHEGKLPPKNRARQNVIFEHGYLIAKLGRENVCALVKGDVEIPNDISGVVYTPLDKHGAWKSEIKKELKACGYQIIQD